MTEAGTAPPARAARLLTRLRGAIDPEIGMGTVDPVAVAVRPVRAPAAEPGALA